MLTKLCKPQRRRPQIEVFKLSYDIGCILLSLGLEQTAAMLNALLLNAVCWCMIHIFQRKGIDFKQGKNCLE